ncbi:MAG: DoxX family protein [Myxococcota bacterium]
MPQQRIEALMFTLLLSRQAERVFALLRIVYGMMWSFHGVQKVFGFQAKFQPKFPTQLWFGGIIELVAGVLIALGLFTRCAAFVASGTMAVAYLQFHWKLQLGTGLIPTVNQGELAVVYCFAFLYIACRGPGLWSLDAVRTAK